MLQESFDLPLKNRNGGGAKCEQMGVWWCMTCGCKDDGDGDDGHDDLISPSERERERKSAMMIQQALSDDVTDVAKTFLNTCGQTVLTQTS